MNRSLMAVTVGGLIVLGVLAAACDDGMIAAWVIFCLLICWAIERSER